MFQHVQASSGISFRSAAQSLLACRHVQQQLLVARANQSAPPPSPSPSAPTLAAPAKQHIWLVVGIGNPGQKYEKTRHNVGFEMIDAIAEAEDIKLTTIQHNALTGKGEIGSAQVFDDMDLNFGVMRLLPKGGHGGHNGMKSVINSLKGCREFPRLKIGIGRPPGTMDAAAYVLQKFDKSEREEMDIQIARGVDAIRQVTKEGILKAASTWNQVRKTRMRSTGNGDIEANLTAISKNCSAAIDNQLITELEKAFLYQNFAAAPLSSKIAG